MKKRLFSVLWILLSVWVGTAAQTYGELWKRVAEAQRKDLPQSALRQVGVIAKKSSREHQYGQLMKARLVEMQLKTSIAPDSLQPAIGRLDALARQTKDDALRAVCFAVLAQLYEDNPSLSKQWQTISNDYKKRALAQPQLLARVAAKDYVPLVVERADDDIFNHELLGIIGRELGAWDVLHHYYEQSGNRRAACISALRQLQNEQHRDDDNGANNHKWQNCPYIVRYDSLLRQYADLAEAGEVAISRYDCMSECRDTPIGDLIDYIDSATKQWAAWKRIGELKTHRQRLTNPQLSIQIGQREVLPQQSQQLVLRNIRHVSRVTLRIYQTRLKGNNTLSLGNPNDYKKIKNGLTELTSLRQTKTLTPHRDYEVFADSIMLPPLREGVYMLEVAADHGIDTQRMLYHVSNLRVMAFGQSNKTIRIVTVNATTGQPVAGASVQIEADDKPLRTLTTNKDGEVMTTSDSNRWLRAYVSTPSDEALKPVSINNGYYVGQRSEAETYAEVFSDRAIYRPGETVHAAAIVYQLTNGTTTRAMGQRQMNARLLDVNGTTVEEKSVTTDDFGKCHADFLLPADRLTGRYRVMFDRWGVSFRVEEYKRPTFEIAFRKVTQAYQMGDTLTLTADVKAYSGVTLPSARVHYRVVRQLPYWWRTCRWRPSATDEGDEVLADSITTTASDGTFRVCVPLVASRMAIDEMTFYRFVVTADVTDGNGETQSATTDIPLGTRPSMMTTNLSEQVRADQQTTLTFTRRNAAGQLLEGRVRYRFDEGKWHETAANAPTDLAAHHLKSGRHLLQALCEGDTLRQSFVVFSLDDRRPATPTHDWFYVSDNQFPADGQPVTLQVGSSDGDLYIAYELFCGKQVIEKGFLRENKSLYNRKFRYQTDYGDGITMAFAWVKDGVTYHHVASIKRPVEEKRLTMKWKTFRNRLQPGQQEEWQLTIMEPNGRPADAQLMATIYDKSLEQLARHQWTFQPATSLSLPYSRWMITDIDRIWRYASARDDSRYPNSLTFGYIDRSLFPSWARNELCFARGGERGMVLMESVTVAPKAAMMAKRNMAAMEGANMDMAVGDNKVYETTDEMPPNDEANMVPLRTNLQASAYFAPALTTDSTGTVSLRFSLPETLTTWRFMALGHTKEMHAGVMIDEAVAQKQLMVQPNMPRFIRMGDEAQIAARLSNLSDSLLNGSVRLTLSDAETGEVVMTSEQPFTVEQSQTAVAVFHYRPDGRQSLLVCQVVATANGHSDGEQHYLPILPERERVTTTRPITQHGSGTQTIALDTLFPANSSQQRLTIEYTNRPAWLMVQSLAAQSNAHEGSAIDQATMLYTNLLAQHLAKQTPSLQGIIEQWKRETSEEKTLDANLSKDASLRDLLLSETPWVAEARSEAEQRQALATLFDASLMRQRTDGALEKLRKLQLSNGAFPWYGGMQASQYVTISVAEMLARLEKMTATSTEAHALMTRAMQYMDEKVAETVKELKRRESKKQVVVFPSTTELQWLYVNAITQRTLSANAKEAQRYLTSLLKKDIQRQSIYEKAVTAVVLHKQGNTSLARSYAQSLKEYSVYHEETGRYYDTPRATYSWRSYKIPTVVAAIEALRLAMPTDTLTIDEMRQWLLQEKRTQQWDTPLNTTNAIYAFLDGASSLTVDKAYATIAIDRQSVETTTATAAVGYQKTVVDRPKGEMLTITKETGGTSWGAVYAQYLLPSRDIQLSEGGIRVTREVVGGKKNYQVGDRIRVRITIQTQRDLDFVEVIDRKAACLEAVNALSGYRNGAYCAPKDGATHYFFDQLTKGKHVIETEYFIDRQGQYTSGSCTALCAYSPEFRATCQSMTIQVK